MMEAKRLKKFAALHVLGVFVIYLTWVIFFSTSLSLDIRQNEGDTGGELLKTSFTTIGPWRVEYMEFRGAGSGEFGGCARNIFSKKSGEFLVGIDRGCLMSKDGNLDEMAMASLFFGIIYLPFVLLLSLPLLIIGRRKNNPYLIHLGMFVIDLLILYLLFINSGIIPIFNFEHPLHGRALG